MDSLINLTSTPSIPIISRISQPNDNLNNYDSLAARLPPTPPYDQPLVSEDKDKDKDKEKEREKEKEKEKEIGNDKDNENDNSHSHNRKRSQRKTLTANACTACQKRRSKCDGKSPCDTCSRASNVRSSTVCVYNVSARVAKKELQHENGELRRQKALSDQILNALRSDWQVPTILQSLKDQESLDCVANIANFPPPNPCVAPSVQVAPMMIEIPPDQQLQQQLSSNPPSSHASDVDTVLPKHLHHWTTNISQDEDLIRHLFFLYSTCIHPVYLLFDMEQFIIDYETGCEEHCSAFLAAAVCTAACDFLGPLWTSISGKVADVASLKTEFMIEAMFQEGYTDRSARTWLEASRVMLVVHSRMDVSCLTRATGFVQEGVGGG